MRIDQFIDRSVQLEPLEKAIQKVWKEFKQKHKWALTPLKIPRNVMTNTIKGQSAVEEISDDEIANYGLEDNIRKIASQWNWEKSPAPLQLLQSQKYWNTIRDNLLIAITEKEESNQESLKSAINWTKIQLRARQKEWNQIVGPAGELIRARIEKETKEAAHALGKLEDLSPNQKKEWEKNLKEEIKSL